ncbi:MAG TPA: threonine synthase [Anaerolineaceae bacterium]|nr:threonine synthase [Anaerolineaceae bacterium]
MKIFCPDCGTQTELTPEKWRCDCGGAWETVLPDTFDPALIDANETSVWRYKRLYGLDFDTPKVVMGAGWTPLLPISLFGRDVWVKPEYFAPTASFKDRGTELMINILAHQGVTHIAEDSSGNAGASVAAFAARSGMKAEIFVPAHASPAKQAQIAVYGANVNPIPGPRVNAKLAAIKTVEDGVIFASHAFHPGFLLGQQSVAYELWEQLGRRAPDWYVVPVGQGVHLLGVWLGFKRLFAAGLTDRIPHMVGVQATLLAPLCRAFEAGLETVPGVEPLGTSLAEGLAIAQPVRGRRLLQAVRESKGTCVMVEEDEIRAAREEMASHGLYIEPTSATAVAALKHIQSMVKPGDTVVVPLTGSGLKGSPTLK